MILLRIRINVLLIGGDKTRDEAIIAEVECIEKMESTSVNEMIFVEMFYKYMEWQKSEIKPTTWKNLIQRFENMFNTQNFGVRSLIFSTLWVLEKVKIVM